MSMCSNGADSKNVGWTHVFLGEVQQQVLYSDFGFITSVKFIDKMTNQKFKEDSDTLSC